MGAIQFQVLRHEDAAAAVALTAQAFSTDEPLGIALGISFDELDQLLQQFVPQLIAEGLSIVARDADSSELAGVLITDDLAAPLNVDLESLSPKFEPIFSLLGQLDEDYRGERTFPPGHYLHLFMLATSPQFRGRGVAQGMVAACLENGWRTGFRHAVTEATGVISQHVFRKADFADRIAIPYRDFRLGDTAPFAAIQEHPSAILMDRPR